MHGYSGGDSGSVAFSPDRNLSGGGGAGLAGISAAARPPLRSVPSDGSLNSSPAGSGGGFDSPVNAGAHRRPGRDSAGTEVLKYMYMFLSILMTCCCCHFSQSLGRGHRLPAQQRHDAQLLGRTHPLPVQLPHGPSRFEPRGGALRKRRALWQSIDLPTRWRRQLPAAAPTTQTTAAARLFLITHCRCRGGSGRPHRPQVRRVSGRR